MTLFRALKLFSLRTWMASLAFLATACACGITKARYVNYSEDESGGGDTGGGGVCDEAALTEFTAQVQPAIDKTCIGCHSTTPIKGKNLKAGDAAANRAPLKSYGDADKLYNKINAENGESHGGGPQGANLPKANISAWLDKEAECT